MKIILPDNKDNVYIYNFRVLPLQLNKNNFKMAPKTEDKPDHDEEIIYNTGPFEKFFHLLTKLLKNITIEPVVFFYSLGFSITMLPSANLYFDKTCKVSNLGPFKCYEILPDPSIHSFRPW